MAARDRIRKYRTEGGAADLVRVEVLVPREDRDAVLKAAAELRAGKRKRKQEIDAAIAHAIELYGPRATDNIDLSRLASPAARARVLAAGLMERGDARAFILARRLLDLAGSINGAH